MGELGRGSACQVWNGFACPLSLFDGRERGGHPKGETDGPFFSARCCLIDPQPPGTRSLHGSGGRGGGHHLV